MAQPSSIVPPPWQLRGHGYALLFRLPGAFLAEQGFLSDFLRDANPGITRGHSLAGLVLADYHDSNVGPYRELLFTPGMYRFNGRWVFTITKIYVSTAISVRNGIDNWAIPKELATFSIDQPGPHRECWRVSVGEKEIFGITLQKAWRWLQFPVFTPPLPFALAQPRGPEVVATKPRGVGAGQFARVMELAADASCFPDLRPFSPLAVLSIHDFRLTFPLPSVLPADT